jgi:hypothetical protein
MQDPPQTGGGDRRPRWLPAEPFARGGQPSAAALTRDATRARIEEAEEKLRAAVEVNREVYHAVRER